MKFYYFALCFLAVIVYSHAKDKDSSEGPNSYEECLAESGIKEEDIEKLANAKVPKLRCLMACVFEKEGILTDKKIDLEALKESMIEDIEGIDEKTATEIVEICTNYAKTAKDICDETNIIGICTKEQFDERNIKIKM
ncbi:pheromone-binding protein Gp-9 [Copidosoma floridanum]|uniref:pheromone-binding protein Gp-9 n=1 Tax=Copidosoma floridanum TaxID=29053 RepID=UPI0006C9AC29|nr:pheromone-binding protein Gp-9 [Copidosoma floridanum]